MVHAVHRVLDPSKVEFQLSEFKAHIGRAGGGLGDDLPKLLRMILEIETGVGDLTNGPGSSNAGSKLVMMAPPGWRRGCHGDENRPFSNWRLSVGLQQGQ